MNEELYLRNATIKDAKLLYDCKNDAITIENSFIKKKVTWEEHIKWLSEKLIYNNKCKILIAFTKYNYEIGQIRFDKIHKKVLIDYCVSKQYRGKGYGKKILKLGCEKILAEWKDINILIGKVKTTNLASISIFEKLGFKRKNLKNYIMFYYKINKK